MPQAAAQRHHSHRDAEADQIPAAAGEYCQEHRCVCVCVEGRVPGTSAGTSLWDQMSLKYKGKLIIEIDKNPME